MKIRRGIADPFSRSEMLNQIWRDEKLRYLSVGIWNTGFAYMAFGLLYLALHEKVYYLVISCIAHFFAATNAFICQRVLVFRSQAKWWPAFVRFNLVQLLSLLWALAGIVVLVEIFQLNPFASQLVVMSVALVVSYILNRDFTFKA
jgi:putative flippase GtrA